ncbi:transcriptional protein SWT1 [Nylanderia fulva]|uniref:transcriptional protein SWT1 n=1 Tax=Nylanderia fulva TaxID=613905 RepID=UPI0010FB8B4A|nr:transcriptional protein SWT1 [Nylanderia fulva]
MVKRKLPSNWITVHSRSHPDRIYYFNVKTNRSTWAVPVDEDEDNKINNKRQKSNHEETQASKTPERNPENRKTSCQQGLNNKVIDTPQMKIIREKMLQKLIAKDKPVASSSKTSAKLAENKPVSSSKRISRLTKNDESKLDKNDNEKRTVKPQASGFTTFTPQMSVLYEKIQLRNLINKSNSDKKLKINAKSKQEDLNITSQRLIKTQENREKSPRVRRQETANQNKNDVQQRQNKIENVQKAHNQNILKRRQPNPTQKKNIAKERMRILRKNLSLDKEKLKEIGRTIINEKNPQKLTKPNSYNKNNLGSSCLYRNVQVRLTRLHHRILKDALYKNSVTSNDKSQAQQNKELVIENVTKEKLIEQAKQEVLYEEMDWEPLNDEDITQEIEVVRTQLGSKNHVETNYISGNTVELIQHNESGTEPQEKCPLYIVVDTNVFLSNLKIIEEARDAIFKNYPRPFIVIPWTVIHELDYIKNNKSTHELWIKARKAISFIHEHFASKHPRIIGQTREQSVQNKDEFSLTCPDDEILQCCLQICKLQKSVVLLSYDKNLCNKAMIYNILALGRNDPLEKIDYYNVNDKVINYLTDGLITDSFFNDELRLADDVFEDTKMTMKDFLSIIIKKQMSEIYGAEEWELYIIIKPPWTIVTALKCAIKHWIAAINESFQRRAEYILKELLQAFERLPVGGRKLEDVEYILEKCSDLVQAVKADKHSELITQTFNAITELKKKCRSYIINIQQKKLHCKIGTIEDVQEQEIRAGKVFQYFQHVYNYARDICGTACSNAGIAHSFNFKPVNLSLLPTPIEYLRPEISKKVADLTQSLNKILLQAEHSNIKYQTLLCLQQNLNTFLTDTERQTFDVTPLDIYYCIILKEEPLKTGLKQLQDLTTHFCALALHI